MKRKHTTLWQFLRTALRHAWLLLYGLVWSLFGSATRIRDNLLPDTWKEKLQTHRLWDAIPPMNWQVWAIGILALIIVAIVRSALLQLRVGETAYFDVKDEVNELKQTPLSVQLTIHEIIHRPSFETHAYWNRDVFLRVSADLISPRSTEVQYDLAVILRGKTIPAEWLKDVDQWCRTEIVRHPNPFDPNEDKPCYNMDDLSPRLNMGQKVDGWLHFRTGGLPDGEMAKCKLRVIARSGYGASHIDMPEGSFPVVPADWKVVLKKDVVAYSLRSGGNALPPPI